MKCRKSKLRTCSGTKGREMLFEVSQHRRGPPVSRVKGAIWRDDVCELANKCCKSGSVS